MRELFGDNAASLELTRDTYVERASSPEAYCQLFKETFGPVVALYDGLADEPERLVALDREFLEFAVPSNRADGDAAEFEYEYLLAVARKRP